MVYGSVHASALRLNCRSNIICVMLCASIHPTVSAPRLTPILRPFLRLSGALSTLPRLTEGAIKMVELRKKEGNTVSVSSTTTFDCFILRMKDTLGPT